MMTSPPSVRSPGHGDRLPGWVVGILVVTGVPLGQELVCGDVERLPGRSVQHFPALLASDLHYLDLMI